MKSLVKIIFAFLFISFLIGMFSCSPTKKLLRLRAKHPELFQGDTVKVIDTIFIIRESKDTSFIYNSSKDTIVINEGRLTMKYFYSKDTVFLGGECRDSVIIREVQVPIERAVIEKESPWWIWLIIGGLILLIFLMVWKK